MEPAQEAGAARADGRGLQTQVVRADGSGRKAGEYLSWEGREIDDMRDSEE